MEFSRVFCNVRAYVSCRGYDGILLSVQACPVNSRWHRGSGRTFSDVRDSSLTEFSFLSGTFFVIPAFLTDLKSKTSNWR